MRWTIRMARAAAALLACLAPVAQSAAHPVVYTAYAITDGRLGSEPFRSAEVRLRMVGDSRMVAMSVEGDAVVYRNESGEATITITRGSKAVTARIAPGQLYVRYDVTHGAVGFGSHAVGPGYPLSLSCGVYSAFACPRASSGAYDQIVAALADIQGSPAHRAYYSRELPSLRTTLQHPTLLTGYLGACAVAYSSGWCPADAAVPIRTDRGDLFLRDAQVSGTAIFTVTASP